jgi:hypothetical protein
MSFEFGGLQGYVVDPEGLKTALASATEPYGSMFFSRFYPPALWAEATAEVRRAMESGGSLSELGAAALLDLVCRTGKDAGFIKVPIEVGPEFGGFARRWYPRLLGSPELADQALGGGVMGIRGAGRFSFGSLSSVDLQALGERTLSAEDRGDLASDSGWGDLWAEAFLEMIDQARAMDATLVFAPHYIELLGDSETYEGSARPPEERPPDAFQGPGILETLKTAVERGATDIHLATGAPLMFRIRGRLEPLAPDPLTTIQLRQWLNPVLTDGQVAQFEKEGLVASFGVKDVGRFRLVMTAQRAAVTASLRVLPMEAPTLKKAKLKPALATTTPGLTLVAGAAGSGRTTAVAAILRHLTETVSCRILTIEEPIEYVLRNAKGIGAQIELGSDVPGLDRALLQALQGDWNVVAIDHVDTAARAEAARALSGGRRVYSTVSGRAAEIRKRFPGATVVEVAQKL